MTTNTAVTWYSVETRIENSPNAWENRGGRRTERGAWGLFDALVTQSGTDMLVRLVIPGAELYDNPREILASRNGAVDVSAAE